MLAPPLPCALYIALINDPDYSILNECLPYISQRVLTDDSPRARRALKTFVYESSEEADAAPPQQHATHSSATPPHAAAAAAAAAGVGGALVPAAAPVMDAPRLARLASGFQSFSASAGGMTLDDTAQRERYAIADRTAGDRQSTEQRGPP